MALLAAASAAQANEGFVTETQNVVQENGYATAVLKVTNHGPEAASAVVAQCVFLDDDGVALDVAQAVLPSAAVGADTFGKVVARLDAPIASAMCRVIDYRPG